VYKTWFTIVFNVRNHELEAANSSIRVFWSRDLLQSCFVLIRQVSSAYTIT